MTTILILSDYAHVKGGDSKVAILSALGLRQAGYRVIFFAGVGPIDERLINAGIETICLYQYDLLSNPNRISAALHGIWNSKSLKTLKKILLKLDQKQTVIHIHSVVKSLSPAVYTLLFKYNFKIVTTLHDYFLACPNGSFFHYGLNQICDIRPLSVKCFQQNCDSRNYGHKLWRFFRTFIQQYVYKVPSKIPFFITLSNLSESILRSYLPSSAYIFRLDNPIDISKQPPVDIKEENLFAYIGRVSKEKGIDLLISIASELNRKVLIFGDGPLYNYYKKIKTEIEFMGWKNSNELQLVYNNLRAIIYPSLWYEVQPLVVLESLAKGVPVVVPDTSAAKELIVNGETGLLFKGGDSLDLLKKLKLLENTKFAQKLGKAAYYKYWKKPYSLERHIAGLTNIYNIILNS